MIERFTTFLVASWHSLPWLMLATFVLEYLFQIIGLKSFWLIRRPKPKKGQKKATVIGAGSTFFLGFFLAIVILGLSFVAYEVNSWLSFGLQVFIAALMLDNRRLFVIGDKIAYMLGSNKAMHAAVLLSRFVGRNATTLNGHEIIGLTMNTSKAAVPAASVGPLVAMLIGGVPLMVLVKLVLVNDWKRRDPLSAPEKQASVSVIHRPANALSNLMLKLTASIMGFVFKKTPVSGVKYMLSDLERNGRHFLITSLVCLILSIDVLIIVRLVLKIAGG